MKQFYYITILLLTFSCGKAQERKYISHKETSNTAEVSVSDGKYIFRFYNENIVETTFLPKGETFNPDSHAVVLEPSKTELKQTETANELTFGASKIMVRISKSPFRVTYLYGTRELLSEKNGYTKRDSTEVLDFQISANEALYGGGARVLGLNRRGNRLELYNRAQYGYETRAELMSFTMPLVLSSKLYAVHFDNPARGFLDLDSKKDNTLAYETISGRKTYQVIAADDWKSLVGQYAQLTGHQPLPPRWAFGNFSSRFGYHSQKEAEATIAKFRAQKIPVDAIIFDLYWFGKEVKGTMGNLAVFRDSFPNFEKMVENFNKQGVKTVLITEPFVLTTSDRWKEAVDKKILGTNKFGAPYTYDFFFGNTGLIDVFKPQARDWYWNIYKDLANKGVAGIWGDLGEPEMHPSAMYHATGKADQLHNIYGHKWAELIAEGYEKDFPNQRPFILMRSGFSGSQRFGMIPWSGDVNRSWGGFSGQPEIALEMGMQGLGYMHSDLGGFAGANLDDELYVRWLQYGVFNPVFRPHAQEEVASEPVFRSENAMKLAKKAIDLRYSLMPYNYTIAFENSSKGTPLMRPLLFEEPGNTALASRSDEYLWGNDFLVAPVVEKGQKEKQVYFPVSSNWYSFYSGKKYNSGTTATITLAEDHIPVFVRGGAFIPSVKTFQTTKDYSTKNLILDYFYDLDVAHSEGSMYNDDGTTPHSFEKGRYELLHFSAATEGNTVNIKITNEKGVKMMEGNREFTFVFHHSAAPKQVYIDGKKIKYKWVKEKEAFTFSFKYNRGSIKNISIQLD